MTVPVDYQKILGGMSSPGNFEITDRDDMMGLYL